MEAERDKLPFLTVENFMASVPDAATREELYDVLGDDPMFAPEMLAKARETLDRLQLERGEGRLAGEPNEIGK